MLPLKDENPSRTFPFVTLLLIAANLAVFVYEALLPRDLLEQFVLAYGAVPARFTASLSRPLLPLDAPWITLVTSMFLHGGLMHIAGNMLYLWIFGDNIEDRVGHLRFVAFYLICGISAAAVQIVASPASRAPLVGASGAIAGILGAYVLLFPGARVLTLVPIFFFIRIVRIPAIFVLGLWFLLQVLAAPGSAVGGAGVAFFAHVGGFLVGMMLIGVLLKRLRRSA